MQRLILSEANVQRLKRLPLSELNAIKILKFIHRQSIIKIAGDATHVFQEDKYVK